MKRPILTGVICLALSTVTAARPSPAALQAAPPSPATTQQSQSAPQSPSQPPPIFRAAVDYVEIDATVTDADGRVVTDLTREDFEVTEGGHPQTIDAFSLVKVPTTEVTAPKFARRAVEADVQRNEGADGRLYVFVMDDLHVAATRTPRTRDLARDFLMEQFRPNDLGAVIFTSGTGQRGQDFTSNRRLLLAAIDRFIGDGMPTLTEERMARGAAIPSGILTGVVRHDATGRALPADPGSAEAATIVEATADAMSDAQRGTRALRTLSVLRQTSEFLSGLRGRRKALLFFSEGIGYDFARAMGDGPGGTVGLELRETIGAATRGNVRYYGIDPTGLDFDMLPERASLETRRDGFPSVNAVSDKNAEVRLAQESLRSLAVNTGGIALVNTNNFSKGYEQIVRENSTYFVLGYASDNAEQDGKFRKVSVKVKRSGLRVQARGGYYAGRNDSATLAARFGSTLSLGALASPLALNDLPVRMVVAPFRPQPQPPVAPTPGTETSATPAAPVVSTPMTLVAIAAEIDVSQCRLTTSAGEMPEQLDVFLLATDARGRTIQGPRYSAPLSMSLGAAARVKANRLRVWSHMSLAPGRYQIRLASTVGSKVGSVVYDVHVPDFSTVPFSMSGVAVTSGTAVNTMTLVDSDHQVNLPGPPMAIRRFSVDEDLSMFVELYQNVGAPPRAMQLTAELQGEKGDVVGRVVEQRAADKPPAASGGQAFNPHIPLKGLKPGTYLLHVEGRADGERTSVSRDIEVEVVP